MTTTNSYQGFGKLTANHLMQDLEGQRLWQGGTKAVFLLFYVRSFKLHVFYRCAPVSTEVNDQQASHQSRSHDFPFKLSSHLMSEYDSRWPLMWTQHFSKCSCPCSCTSPVTRSWFCARGHQIVLGYLEYPVSERNSILCRCPGISAWAPSVNIALVSVIEVFLHLWQIPLGVSSPHYTIITKSAESSYTDVIHLWSGLCCYTEGWGGKCSEILATIKLLYNPRVNKVFTHSLTQVTLPSNSASILTRFIRSSSLTVLLFFWFCCCFSSCCFSTSASCEKNKIKCEQLDEFMRWRKFSSYS